MEEKKNLSLHIKYSFIKIMTGSDLSRKRLPMMAVRSQNPGPVLWLVAGIHGDEVGGIVVAQEIFKSVSRRLTKGALYAFPLVNPIGFESLSRDITMSSEDINRCFPGNANGSLAERITEKIFTTIMETNPTLVLDLHNDWQATIPYSLVDTFHPSFSQDAHKKTKEFAEKSGFLVIEDTEKAEGTVSFAFLQKGIPSLTLELGESYVVNEKNIEDGVKSITNIMTHLGMIEPTQPYFEYPVVELLKEKVIKYSPRPLSSKSGIIRFIAKPGSIVRKGQHLAKIYNAFGKLQETIICMQDGIVLGVSESSVAFPGAPIMCFGVF